MDTKGSWFERAGSEGLGQDNTLEDRGSAMSCCALNNSLHSGRPPVDSVKRVFIEKKNVHF